MRKLTLLLAALGLALIGESAEAAATYSFAAPNYVSIHNQAGCSACFTTAMTVVGGFTLAAPLGPGLINTAVTPTAYSFNDGLTTYSSSDSQSYVGFRVATDATGQQVSAAGNIVRWKTANHTVGQRVDLLTFSGSSAIAYNNAVCGGVSNGVCDTPNIAAASAAATPAGGWTATLDPPAIVPTLGGWAIALVALALGAAGLSQTSLSRRRAA